MMVGMDPFPLFLKSRVPSFLLIFSQKHFTNEKDYCVLYVASLLYKFASLPLFNYHWLLSICNLV